jgi:hypothetical protein
MIEANTPRAAAGASGMSRNYFVLIASLIVIVFAGQNLLAQAVAPTTKGDRLTTKQKNKEEIALEKKKAAEQWPTNSQKALDTWATARQKRRECQKQASDQKLYFAKRSRFVKECLASKAQ